MKRLRNFINRLMLTILSLTVFAGAFGLSYQAHYCGGHLSGIAFYTELGIQDPVSCACIEHSREEHTGYTDNLNKKSCCKDESFYSRLVPQYSQNHSLTQFARFSAAEAVNGISYTCLLPADNKLISDNNFRPPPLSGRHLVLFLSQQRIPNDIAS